MELEELRLDADVLSRDGHKLGTLHRFVIDKATFRLTHIVVDTGILRSGEPLWKGGFGLDHDRMLPIGAVTGATSHAISVSMSADEFRDHSTDYLEEYFVNAPDLHKGAPDASDLHRLAMSIPGEPGPYIMHAQTSLEAGEGDVRADSPVWRLQPHEKIGEVERVIYDEDTKAVTGIVVRRGFLFTREVVLPVGRVAEVVAGIVRVNLNDDELDALEEFHPPD
jgi:sporulation protein YlmC with PRC-barrel domain